VDRFAYPRKALGLSVLGSETRGGATIEDVSFAGADGGAVSAYIVSPKLVGAVPAVLYMHMLGRSVGRSQFLDEAVELAGAGIVSLHVQGTFPWDEPPRDLEHDRELIARQVVDLRRGLDLLDDRLGDERTTATAFVGHDYGAMYGALLANVDARVDAAVLIAGHPHFSAWFTKYWELGDAAGPAYLAGLAELDPVRYLASGRAMPLLLQFANDDEFVSESERGEVVLAALEPKETRMYAGDHHLTEEATVDRTRWLLSRLTDL
jgi:pimeloyl-ACP methyl ester carboxylesterase